MSYLDSAGSLAVDTLNLVLANDDVLESSAILDHEDSVLVTTLDLASAANTTAVGLHATVEDTADLLGGLEGNGTLGGRDGKRSTLAKSKGIVGGGNGRASSGEASSGSNDGDGELHFDAKKKGDRKWFGVKMYREWKWTEDVGSVVCVKQTKD